MTGFSVGENEFATFNYDREDEQCKSTMVTAWPAKGVDKLINWYNAWLVSG